MLSEKNTPPFITVCMPVRNEVRFIENTLTQLLAQDYPKDRFEIIVADGGSDDGTRDLVNIISQRFSQVVLLDNPKQVSSAGRNIGFKNGKGDILMVVDGHCHIPDGKLFEHVVACFDKSQADCLGRPQPLNPPDTNRFQKAVALARQARIGHAGDSLIYSDYEGYVSPVSHGAVYKKRVFEIIGYVDESFDACEDGDFNIRVEKAGLKTYMSPSIAIQYFPRENFSSLFNQMIRYGKGRFRLLKKHPDTFSIGNMIPPMFVAGLFMLLPLCLMDGALGAMGMGLYGIYLLLLLLTSVSVSLKNGLKYFVFIGPILFTVHAGLGLGFLEEAFSWFYRGLKQNVN